VSGIKDWLNWTPANQKRIQEEPEVSNGKKPAFDTIEAPLPGNSEIIQDLHTAPDTPPATAEHRRNNMGSPRTEGIKSIKTHGGCPYALPDGIRLVRYERKTPPVALTVFSVVNDPDKFIWHALAELKARLHHPVQIKAGDSVFELLSKLADCGLELRLEWPPERIIENPPESEPSKPSKPPATPELNAHGVDITDEDMPF